jgi:IclR family transcriptional regulator, acetate operon repressor
MASKVAESTDAETGSQSVESGKMATAGGPRSLLRTLRIIEHVAGSPDGSTLARLSVELKSPKSSLLGLLRPLCGFGYVAFANGRYVLGPAAYRLGVTIMPTLSMSRIALPILRQLAEQCEETVLIATLDREAGRATYIEKIESSRSIRYTVPLGTARPLYCSAAGRVLLAHADREYIEHYLRTETFEPLTPQTLTRPAELRAMLPNIRQQGLAVTVGEVSSDVAGFAAPIFNHQGLVIAALAIGAPVSRVRAYSQATGMRAREAAESISFGFGYPGAALKVQLPEATSIAATSDESTTSSTPAPRKRAGFPRTAAVEGPHAAKSTPTTRKSAKRAAIAKKP